jgi:hypothetical protein
MSWFKHKPRPKDAPKQHPHHTSPVTEKYLTELKKTGPAKPKKPGK